MIEQVLEALPVEAPTLASSVGGDAIHAVGGEQSHGDVWFQEVVKTFKVVEVLANRDKCRGSRLQGLAFFQTDAPHPSNTHSWSNPAATIHSTH
jgi:hypothetical protein